MRLPKVSAPSGPSTVANYLRDIYPLRRQKTLSGRRCIIALILASLFLFGTDPCAPTCTDFEAWHSRLPYPLFLSSRLTQSPTSAKAIVSNVQNEAYVPLALVLAYTIRKYNSVHLTHPVDLVLLLPHEHDITSASLTRLEQVGWQFRYEDDLEVNGTDTLPRNYRRNFIKLRLWSWVEYRKIAFLDADTMVMGDIGELLSDGFGMLFDDAR
jgi:hypothetical protein